MRKVMLLVLLMAFMSVILLGCQSKDNDPINIDMSNAEQESMEQQTEDDKVLLPEGEIKKVSISKSKGNSPIIYDDDFSIEVLKDVFLSAVKGKGIVSMISPEFYVDVIYENGNEQSFHLWIGEESTESALVKTDDTHTAYSVSEEMTKKLIDLIE